MSGLPIGDLIDPSPPSRGRALLELFDPRRPSGEAVRNFMRAFVRGFETRLPLRLNRSVHTLTIAPPGAGKSSGLIVPFLRECRESMVINDVKGELYALTASHRRAMGHTVHALDPWRLVTSTPASLNPFDLEDPSDAESLDFARDAAESLIVRNPRDDPHWPDKAEQFIGAVVSYVLTMCEPQDTHMKSVCDILADRKLLDRVTRSLQNSPAWGGVLSRLGHMLAHSGTEEKESVISTCNRMLRFMNSTAVEESLRTSSFDPRELTKGRMTVYLVIPAHHLRPAAGLLRLWLSTLHRVVIRGGVQR